MAEVHRFSSRAVPCTFSLLAVPSHARWCTRCTALLVSLNRGEQPCSIYMANAIKKCCLCWMSYVRWKCRRMLLPTKIMVAYTLFLSWRDWVMCLFLPGQAINKKIPWCRRSCNLPVWHPEGPGSIPTKTEMYQILFLKPLIFFVSTNLRKKFGVSLSFFYLFLLFAPLAIFGVIFGALFKIQFIHIHFKTQHWDVPAFTLPLTRRDERIV